jgi:hypothetical protein
MRGRRMGRRGEIVCGEVEVGVCGMAWGAQWVVAVASGGGDGRGVCGQREGG